MEVRVQSSYAYVKHPRSECCGNLRAILIGSLQNRWFVYAIRRDSFASQRQDAFSRLYPCKFGKLTVECCSFYLHTTDFETDFSNVMEISVERRTARRGGVLQYQYKLCKQCNGNLANVLVRVTLILHLSSTILKIVIPLSPLPARCSILYYRRFEFNIYLMLAFVNVLGCSSV